VEVSTASSRLESSNRLASLPPVCKLIWTYGGIWCVSTAKNYSVSLNMTAVAGNNWTTNAGHFYRAMRRARESGRLRAYFLGVVLHSLSLNPAIITAVVIDDVVFDDLFRDLVTINAEGQVITSIDNNQSVRGLPFTEETVQRFLDNEPLGGTSAACLALAWQHRESLMLNCQR